MPMRPLIGGGGWFPGLVFWNTANPAYVASGRVIDASGEKAGFVWRAPKTGTIDTVESRMAGVTQDPGTNGIKFSIQALDTSALPAVPNEAATYWRLIPDTDISSGSWTVPGLMTTDGTDTGTKMSVTKGQLIGSLYEFASFQAGKDITIAGLDVTPGATPYFCRKVGGVWAAERFAPVMAVKYDDGSYPYVHGFCIPAATLVNQSVSTSTTPDEIGMAFVFPSDTLIGAVNVRVDAIANFDIDITDSQNQPMIPTQNMLANVRTSATGRSTEAIFEDFIAQANEVYTLWVKPTTTTAITVSSFTVNDAAILTEQEGGASWFMRTRTDGGEITDILTQRPMFSVQVGGYPQATGGQDDPIEGAA